MLYSPFDSNKPYLPISARPLSSFFSVSFAISVNLVINSNTCKRASQGKTLTRVFLVDCEIAAVAVTQSKLDR